MVYGQSTRESELDTIRIWVGLTSPGIESLIRIGWLRVRPGSIVAQSSAGLDNDGTGVQPMISVRRRHSHDHG